MKDQERPLSVFKEQDISHNGGLPSRGKDTGRVKSHMVKGISPNSTLYRFHVSHKKEEKWKGNKDICESYSPVIRAKKD